MPRVAHGRSRAPRAHTTPFLTRAQAWGFSPVFSFRGPPAPPQTHTHAWYPPLPGLGLLAGVLLPRPAAAGGGGKREVPSCCRHGPGGGGWVHGGDLLHRLAKCDAVRPGAESWVAFALALLTLCSSPPAARRGAQRAAGEEGSPRGGGTHTFSRPQAARCGEGRAAAAAQRRRARCAAPRRCRRAACATPRSGAATRWRNT